MGYGIWALPQQGGHGQKGFRMEKIKGKHSVKTGKGKQECKQFFNNESLTINVEKDKELN